MSHFWNLIFRGALFRDGVRVRILSSLFRLFSDLGRSTGYEDTPAMQVADLDDSTVDPLRSKGLA